MNKPRELNFRVRPGEILKFEIECDYKNPIKVSGHENGSIKIKVENGRIEYTPKKDFSGTEKLTCKSKKDKKEIITNVNISVGYAFKAKSHILSLLGDELIGSDNLAIFELVKNAYDADAKNVIISLNNLNTPDQSILVEDDGNGMTFETLRDIWLEIGTDFKRGTKRKPSPVFKRISLGEKGVGRLAIYKLGKKIQIETQVKGNSFSNRIIFNWAKLIEDSEYIEDTQVTIEKVRSSLFKQGQGTRIIVGDLRKENWIQKDLTDLARKVNSIKSPFKKIEKFDVKVTANDHHQEWLTHVKDPDTILNEALYYFEFNINGKAEITWHYKFNPPKQFGLKKQNKKSNAKDKHLRISNSEKLFPLKQLHLKKEDLINIGPINGRFYVYNLLATVLKAFGQSNAIKGYVKDNSGVRVFRDGIRVYNYGEPEDDWLGLDLARVQKLGEKFSKNTVIGAIGIDMRSSHGGLVEKTNREGFDDNIYYKKFRAISNHVFDLFQEIAIGDREEIKGYLEEIKPVKNVGLSETIKELEKKLKEKKIDKELKPLLKRVQKDYSVMRDVMLNSGMSGLNLAVVFHEVDREVRFINTDLINKTSLENIKGRVKNLIQLLENFSPLLQQNKNILINASQLVERAKQINTPRFKFHEIIFSSPLITHENEDFQIKGPGNLLISALSNIIDNAIYWVSAKKDLEGRNFKSAIYIGSDISNFSGPAIIIADNGSGFNLEPEDLILPFRTTKPGGMGLGLYFTNMVMEMLGGKLLFPDNKETNLPKAYNGATIALVFPK